MQPEERVTGQAPKPRTAATTPAPVAGGGSFGAHGRGPTRNRRARLILAMVAGIVGLLCMGGVGVVVALYDDATKIERAEPDAVVDGFLGAYLGKRDDREAELYTCKPAPDLSRLAAFRADAQSREKTYSIGIRFTWRNFDIQTQGEGVNVSVDVVRTISDGSEETFDRWRFQLINSDGWRVCGASPAQ